MTEEFLHFIWKNKLFYPENITSFKGENVSVISTGIHNYDSGPDFFNAKIKINETLWAGNVEIHVKSSDWEKHNHHTDQAYNNVILHIVEEYDRPVKMESGSEPVTVKLNYNRNLLSDFLGMKSNEGKKLCSGKLEKTDAMVLQSWLDRLLFERIERKSNEILKILENNQNDWEETFYKVLFRNFGFGKNALPFELLANSFSLTLLKKHSGNLPQIEAILFGQSGLPEIYNEKPRYLVSLEKEYFFLKHKYRLKSIDGYLWKFSKTRPVNFPTIRLAFLAKLINDNGSLFSDIIKTDDILQLRELFTVELDGFWKTHYNFTAESLEKTKNLGKEAVNAILINTIVPVKFSYYRYYSEPERAEKILQILDQLPPEENSIITNWKKQGIFAENAAHTQALLQLSNEYCDLKKCFYCNIGYHLLKTGSPSY
ncbi:MAG: hypothetical protein A2W91_17870 [Bacteroidetes bacterium GWF2_38_335]|nr:MAG: hypothetical protein A2W91_17870 [Bacteroidetes bacterium GWF2_38_335]OFY80159.1 MAG: hypothetical protein A2281_12770 [Bacteroidetes bacterium RIFOXYA12_FULL_38_20]HBS88512.1 DUF2851 domain-containing protein [Bacteroidales bacterium]